MNEEIREHLAELNATWQRYARAIEQDIDTIPIYALNRDFVHARGKLASLGITASMLEYDSTTMTFSLFDDN